MALGNHGDEMREQFDWLDAGFNHSSKFQGLPSQVTKPIQHILALVQHGYPKYKSQVFKTHRWLLGYPVVKHGNEESTMCGCLVLQEINN